MAPFELSFKETGSQSVVPFLASRVPELHANLRSVDFDRSHLEVDGYGWQMVDRKIVLTESLEQRCLAHSALPDE